MSEKPTVSFNISFLKESAASLAEIHATSPEGKVLKPVKPILEDAKKILNDAYRVLSRLAKAEQELSPAAEWLIDNFYIIQEQIVQVGVDFPKGYQKNLPLLNSGEYSGLPRVYELVLNYLTHTDNMVDNEVLIQYTQNYQQVETLMQGEIWAIPIMIRLILIQRLAEKASRILHRKSIDRDVNQLIKEIEEHNLQEPGAFTSLLSNWMNTHSGNSAPLQLIELFNQLQASGLLLEEQKRWFNYRIRQFDMTLEEAMRIEAQKQSRLQVSIQNAVISLRETSETDWAEFVEECSVIDRILSLDPLGRYPLMDFQTRDSYRKAVERLSSRSNYSETEVAEEALLMAEEESKEPLSGPEDVLGNLNISKQHIGYYLIGEGYIRLTKKISYSPPLRERIQKKLERKPGWYLGVIAFNTLILMAILWIATETMWESPVMTPVVLLVSFFPALDLSITVVNRFFAFLLPPRVLPKMKYREGIPGDARTMVIIPTIFTSPEDVQRQIENLEIRSLANPDTTLQFALLSDFRDADEKELEGDNAILEAIGDAVGKLNNKYGCRYGDKFFVLHRERLWNESEGVWMGWERKRGKLEEFNLLLINPEAETSYNYIEGDFISSVSQQPVQFVITLDSDTKLPPDSAKNLVRTIAHPLNRAFYDPDMKRITKGYAIIQPRISIPPESARKTWFSRTFAGNVGLDPYSTAVSDIYQDLAGEAVFVGKGIYDVNAFHTVLDNRFPENRILSHDLIESTYLRTGLATDIELFDDYPTTYSSFSKRNHRWTRGDWQIAAWLFPHAPEEGGKKKNTISLLSRWKIFDNLRRSLNPFFLILFFIAGLFWMPGSGWIWTAAAFGILAFPIYVSLSSDMLNRPAKVRWKLYLYKVRVNLKMNTLQAISTVIILPHQAVVQLDAIFRTLYRLKLSNKKLLEWTTASQTESTSHNSLGAYFWSMMFSVVLGIAILAGSILFAAQYLWIVIPVFLLWVGSPIYAWYLSQPAKLLKTPYTKADEVKLRIYARRTWFYFERFVDEVHFWLPPDNHQEDPPLPTVERTSPTNIGLALVSTQVAYNMGYITFGELLARQEKTLSSLNELEQFKGHFYNWYETRLGEVLSPRYISTVDSGNLAAGLIVVKEAVKQGMKERGINKNFRRGMHDTLLTVREIFDEYRKSGILPVTSHNRISQFSASMLEKLDGKDIRNKPVHLDLLQSLKEDAAKLSGTDLLPMGSILGDQQMADLRFWLESPLKQVENMISEYKCISGPDGIDIHKYSPHELRELYNTEGGARFCTRVMEKWRHQAENIVSLSERMIEKMDFSFLYLKKRGLFSIGYNVEKAQLDKGTYDMLASEARIASYIAIAKGDIPVEHWFRLSRRLTSLNQDEILLSWGGTMFEYLMPMLFMRTYPDTLISHTYQNVLRWQRDYGGKRNQPWGFSESAYNFLNIDMHYQYRAFGAPGLGLKRGLADEYVVAPYASMLSLMIDPKASLENLVEIEKAGGVGLYGFYDAIDYTPAHLNDGEAYKVVKTYMAHHHGMSLIAIENLLNAWSINNYFHNDLRVRGCELILQERIPRGVPIKEPHPIDAELEPGQKESVRNVVEHSGINELDLTPPRLHILTNGSYSVFVTHAGTGRSRFEGLAMNGWESDPTVDPLGLFFYIKDTETGKYWSAMHQPVKKKPDRYDTWFHNGKIVTSRVDDWIETTTEICVSPDDPIELRKLTLTNYSEKDRTLEVTSYAEVVLNRPEDHRSHPAFSKLFLQTDYLEEHHAIIVKRRPRSEEERPLWLIHTFADQETEDLREPLQFETERSNFIGRGRSLSNPRALDKSYRLEGVLGNVSDPIVSLKKNITIRPGEKAQLTFGLGFARSREEAVRMSDMYDNPHATNRAFDLASVYSTVELNHIGISPKQAHYFQKLASYLFYNDSAFRADEPVIRSNRKKQHELWAYGISGDHPLVIFRINNTDQLKSVKTLLKAHAFWRMRGLKVELLFLNDHAPGYIDEVQEAIQQAIETSLERDMMDKRGGVFVHRADKIHEEDMTLLLSVAYAVFSKKLPGLSKSGYQPEPSSWYQPGETEVCMPVKLKENNQSADEAIEREGEKLHYFNGIGGFSEKGNEYHILVRTDPGTGRHIFPPSPWVNIIANEGFGFTTSERGAGYTWSENSRENKLTSWSNDPVKDSHSEAFFIRDEERKVFWSPAPGPVPGSGSYKVIHGFGYTRYEHLSEGLSQELTQFVPRVEAVKISILTLTNTEEKRRKLSVFRYLDRVLGVDRTISSRYIIPDVSDNGTVLYAQNHYNNEFAGRTVFAAVSNPSEESQLQYTTDRLSFIGRNRSLSMPLALCSLQSLDNKTMVGGDPCAVFRTIFELEAGESASVIFIEGEARTREAADRIIKLFSKKEHVDKELKTVKKYWNQKLSRIQVTTPDKSFDLMVNGWLMYQNLSSRMWARTGFYQSGGAFGFRDQLQDAMAALYVDPKITRRQILLHAEKQFQEGDVLHWWHPPTGRGVRSRITDDRLWLPFVTEFYIEATGDESILNEQVPYISARQLEEFEHEVYLQPRTIKETGTLYEHCCKAIDISLQFGEHNLPLIGAGDWNDGMNRVGEKGKGESVWLGFFIHITLSRFEKICRKTGDDSRAERYKRTAAELKKSLNNEGWDGNWYLRAFYDDGTPLGSSQNDECRIDAISQAWAVISGVASETRGMEAMSAVENHLISEHDRIIRLLTPPFDQTGKNPGYIKGYIPGVRENGGQYTHGALWVVKAMAEMGLGGKAANYFSMINPVNHTRNMDEVLQYKVEPYVVAADVYGELPLTGQGGWTWYTGSGGWMYRVALESILGLQLNKDHILLNPSISPDWPGYSIKIILDDKKTTCKITVDNPDGLESGLLAGTVNGKEIRFDKLPARIRIPKDRGTHEVHLRLVAVK